MNRGKTSIPVTDTTDIQAALLKKSTDSLRLAYRRTEEQNPGLLRARHFVARNKRLKKDALDQIAATINSRVTVIEDSEAGLRLLDILERLHNEQATPCNNKD